MVVSTESYHISLDTSVYILLTNKIFSLMVIKIENVQCCNLFIFTHRLRAAGLYYT